MKQVLINIIGKVQGVGFRYSAVYAAQKLGLKGYVRNKPDSSVEALAQGEESSILQFIEWCKEGPAHAKIDQLNTKWQEVVDLYESFEIL
ncbi:MAG: acylphosphatase [Candidatus Gracilibacteria bacterium]